MVGRSPCCSQEPDPDKKLSGSCFCTKCPTATKFYICFDGPIGYSGAPESETYLPKIWGSLAPETPGFPINFDGWTDTCSWDTTLPSISTTCGDMGSAFDGPIVLTRDDINGYMRGNQVCNCAFGALMGDLKIKNLPGDYYNTTHMYYPHASRTGCYGVRNFSGEIPPSPDHPNPVHEANPWHRNYHGCCDEMYSVEIHRDGLDEFGYDDPGGWGRGRTYPLRFTGGDGGMRSCSWPDHHCWTRPALITLELEEICTDDTNNTGRLKRGFQEDVNCRNSSWEIGPNTPWGGTPDGVPCAPCMNTTGRLFGSTDDGTDTFELECGEFETFVDFNTICPDDWSWDCASDVDGKYFWLTDDMGEKYHVWYNDLTSDSVDPDPSGSAGGIQVDIKPSCSLIWSNLPPANDPDGDEVLKSEFSPNLNLEHGGRPNERGRIKSSCQECDECLGKLCDDNYLANDPIYEYRHHNHHPPLPVKWCWSLPWPPGRACSCEIWRLHRDVSKPCEDLYKLTNDAISSIKDTSDAMGVGDRVVGEFNRWTTSRRGYDLRGPLDQNGDPIYSGPFSNYTAEEIKCVLGIKSGKSMRPDGNQQADAFDGDTGFGFGDGNVDDGLGGLGNCCHNGGFTTPRLFVKIPTLDEHWGGSGLVDCDSNDPLCVCDAHESEYWGRSCYMNEFPRWQAWGDRHHGSGSLYWKLGGVGKYDGDNITDYGKSNYTLYEYEFEHAAEDFDCFGCNDFSLVSTKRAATSDDGAISLPSSVKVCAGAPCRKKIGLIIIAPEEDSYYNNPDDEFGGSWETGKCLFNMEVRRFEEITQNSNLDVRVEIISPKGPSSLFAEPYSNGDFYCGDIWKQVMVGSWQECFAIRPDIGASMLGPGARDWPWHQVWRGGKMNYGGGFAGGPPNDMLAHPCSTPWGQCGMWGKQGDITGGGNLPSAINITYVDNCGEVADPQDQGLCCSPPHPPSNVFGGKDGCPYYPRWRGGDDMAVTYSCWGCPYGCAHQGQSFPGQCCFQAHDKNPCTSYPNNGMPWGTGCHRVTGQDIKDAWDRLTQGDWLPNIFEISIAGGNGLFAGSGLAPQGGCSVNVNTHSVCSASGLPSPWPVINPVNGVTGWVNATPLIKDVCTIADDWANGISQIYDEAIEMEKNSVDFADCAIGHIFSKRVVTHLAGLPGWGNPIEGTSTWMAWINSRVTQGDCDSVPQEPSYGMPLSNPDHICNQHLKPKWDLVKFRGNDPNDFFDGAYILSGSHYPSLDPIWIGEAIIGTGPITKPKNSPTAYWTLGGGGLWRELEKHRIWDHSAFGGASKPGDHVSEMRQDGCGCCGCDYNSVDLDISTPNFDEKCWAVHPDTGKETEDPLPIGGQITLSKKSIDGCVFGADDETSFWDHIHLNLNYTFITRRSGYGWMGHIESEKRAVLTLYHRGRPVMEYFSKDEIDKENCPSTLELTKGTLSHHNCYLFHPVNYSGCEGAQIGYDTIGIEIEGHQWSHSINNMVHVCDPFSWQASDNAVARFAFDKDKHDDLNSAKIKLVSTDGTTKYYTVRNDGSADNSNPLDNSAEFNTGDTAFETASNFADIVMSSDGHDGKITVSLFEAPFYDSSGRYAHKNIFTYNDPAQAGDDPVIVELKQSVPGEEGNTDIKLIADFEKILDVRWMGGGGYRWIPDDCPLPSSGRWSDDNPSLCRFINGDGCPAPTMLPLPRAPYDPPFVPPPKTNQCLNFADHPNSWPHSCPCKWLENSMPDTVQLTLTI
jgi:hypothetical protein